MKIRTGFVSNSSSSSFVCPICDEHSYLMDGDPTNSSYHCQCQNGHGFCRSHLEKDKTKMAIEMKNFLKQENDYNIPEIDELDSEGLINLFKEDEYGDCLDKRLYLFAWKFYCQIPPHLCPICCFDIISIGDIVRYTLKISDREQIKDEIKEKFSSYKEFKEFLKEKTDESEEY